MAGETYNKGVGVFYMFAIRLVPIMPYGLVNFAAGLTSVNFKDYLVGTTLHRSQRSTLCAAWQFRFEGIQNR